MKFLRYPHKTPLAQPTVITIGHFDGVHLGHQKLFSQINQVKRDSGLRTVVVTMQPLASQYFLGKNNVPVITSFKQKYQLIKNCGVDYFCALNFNEKLANLSAHEFFYEIILRGLKAQHILVGRDFRFGKNRSGDTNELQKLCQQAGIELDVMADETIKQQRVSSTLIRERLAQGDFAFVQKALGRRFSISGKISKGEQLGRTIGYPTINLKIKNRKSPLRGVFCVKVKFSNGQIYSGAASLGTRPTVNGVGEILEVYLFDFNKIVYGENVEVFFHHKIRNEVKFETLEQLKSKINDDVLKVRNYFSKTLK